MELASAPHNETAQHGDRLVALLTALLADTDEANAFTIIGRAPRRQSVPFGLPGFALGADCRACVECGMIRHAAVHHAGPVHVERGQAQELRAESAVSVARVRVCVYDLRISGES